MLPWISRRLRFSLRALLVAMTLACCWLGWEINRVQQRQRLLAEFQGSEVYWFGFKSLTPCADSTRRALSRLKNWRRWLGDRRVYYLSVRSDHPNFSQADFERIKRSFPEAAVRMYEYFEPNTSGIVELPDKERTDSEGER